MLKRSFSYLLITLALMIAPPSSSAAVFDPFLQEALPGLEAGEELSVIVRMREQGDLVKMRRDGRAALKSGKGKLKQFRRAMLEGFKSRADRSQAGVRQLIKQAGKSRFRNLWLINGLEFSADRDLIEALSRLSSIESIELNRTLPFQAAPVVMSSAVPEVNLSAIRAPELWAAGITGQGVTVANLDTGVDASHPALAANWRGGANSWFDPYGTHATPADPEGHGTATMGIMVAADDGGRAISVAPGAQWMAAKIFPDPESGSDASTAEVHQAFQWVLDPDGNPLTDDAPDVVNNSWGSQFTGCYLTYETDIQALKAAGIAVVFSAGNSGFGGDVSPANNPSGFAVGMVAKTSPYEIAPSSSRGPSSCDDTNFPELVAPGVDIYAPYKGSYAWFPGTSFAAPHVSGAMALLRSALPNVTVEEIEQALIATAVDLGQAGPDNDYGYGLVDVAAAFDALAGFEVLPASHDFGEVLLQKMALPQTFIVTNTGINGLDLDTVTIAGPAEADYALITDNCSQVTLASGEQCDYTVQFQPLGVGLRTASVQVVSRSFGNQVQDASLQGVGVMDIIAPVTGVTLTSSNHYVLEWTDAANVVSYRIGVSADDGASWIVIDTLAAPADSYSWLVPELAASLTDVLFGVATYDGQNGTGAQLSLTTSGPFTVQPMAVVVTSPNGGETLTSGETLTVTWGAASRADRYEVSYSFDAGSTWQALATVSGAASTTWTVPVVTATENGTVRVQAYRNATLLSEDSSDLSFSVDPAVTLALPAGGETIASGSLYTITWNGGPAAMSYQVGYSVNNNPWVIIDTVNAPALSLVWAVPPVARELSVRIGVAAYGGVNASGSRLGSDISDAPVTVAPPAE